MEIKIVKIIQTRYKDATDYPVSYGQRYCEACGGELDTGFRCMKCGRQHQWLRSISFQTEQQAKDAWNRRS